jgi:hypothetical protein
MRPFVSSSVALAAVSLIGVSVAGVSSRFAAGAVDVRADAASSSFFAPPSGLSLASLPRPEAQPQPKPQQAPQQVREPGIHEVALPPESRTFFFTRAIYSSSRGGWGRGRGSWATDYPKADRQFLVVLKRLTNLDAYDLENAVPLDDPALRRYPFLYALEVGRMELSQDEIHGLRDYLNAGGFLVIDDFWGPQEWSNFEVQMARVLPGRPIVDVPRDHPLFTTFYEIDEILQVPNVGNGRRGGPTWECYGCETPEVKGIFDDDGRLMVVINFNTDLGDAWEWAEDPWYPLPYSTFAYQMGVNMIVYAMSH